MLEDGHRTEEESRSSAKTTSPDGKSPEPPESESAIVARKDIKGRSSGRGGCGNPQTGVKAKREVVRASLR